ncbi:MAG: carboxypeptidase-like regulatory domain-containing protein [Planctomycetaceae bacterium]|nr:carboxypeptidase-like regulatory domain-containing protein [Planctomycetaceae bacterium]
MPLNKIALLLFSSLLLISAVSCGGKLPPRPEGMPNPVSCTIIVQDESGTPIDKALVVLRPEDSEWTASGSTDTSGRTSVKTNGLYNGAVPGKYKVLISKSEIISTGQMSDEGTEVTQTNVLIDPKFSKKEATPFTLEVPVSGTCTETFKVSPPAKR